MTKWTGKGFGLELKELLMLLESGNSERAEMEVCDLCPHVAYFVVFSIFTVCVEVKKVVIVWKQEKM